MINIRPVSDLRNKYPEIEELVLKNNEPVYLTKNGYGSMVVLSLEKYSELMSEKEYDRYVENLLIATEAEMDKVKTYTQEELDTYLKISDKIINNLKNLSNHD